MRLLILTALLAPLFVTAARAAEANDVRACVARIPDLTKQADQFNGDPMIKRLITADFRRAVSESNEGDADECNEALDHATKLLNGQT